MIYNYNKQLDAIYASLVVFYLKLIQYEKNGLNLSYGRLHQIINDRLHQLAFDMPLKEVYEKSQVLISFDKDSDNLYMNFIEDLDCLKSVDKAFEAMIS